MREPKTWGEWMQMSRLGAARGHGEGELGAASEPQSLIEVVPGWLFLGDSAVMVNDRLHGRVVQALPDAAARVAAWAAQQAIVKVPSGALGNDAYTYEAYVVGSVALAQSIPGAVPTSFPPAPAFRSGSFVLIDTRALLTPVIGTEDVDTFFNVEVTDDPFYAMSLARADGGGEKVILAPLAPLAAAIANGTAECAKSAAGTTYDVFTDSCVDASDPTQELVTDSAQVKLAQQILAKWDARPGVSGTYGSVLSDRDGVATNQRFVQTLAAFQSTVPGLRTDGVLDVLTLTALKAWEQAHQAAPPPPVPQQKPVQAGIGAAGIAAILLGAGAAGVASAYYARRRARRGL